MAKLERRELVSAAKELIDVMDLKDKGEPIKVTKDTTIEELTKLITEAIRMIDPKQDVFEPETQAVIDALSAEDEPADEPDEDEEETKQEVAEKIHKKNIADAPVNKGKKAPKEEPAEEDEQEEAPKSKAKAKPAKEEKTEKADKPKQLKKAGEPGKPGVIATIASLIEKSGKKGITKDEILEELKEQFPDRPVDSMKATINVQLPARISKEKFELKKLDGGKWAKA
jgi:outer membrane biosynthesis protein TonB